MVDIRKKLEPLAVLDLKKCPTVGKTVEQMEKCAIGARMIGEVSKTLTELVKAKEKIVIIYDGKKEAELGKLILEMVSKRKWFTEIYTPEEYQKEKRKRKDIALIVGNFSERYEEAIFRKTKRAIFINLSNQFKPGQVRDGYFPDFIYADPRLAVPILFLVLEERIEKKASKAANLMNMWSKMGGSATQAADGFKTLQAMIKDPDCIVFGTFSGIMTVACLLYTSPSPRD